MKKETKWQNTNLGRERRDFLNERIRAVRYAGRRGSSDNEPKEPASVRAARAIVEKYEAAREKVVKESERERSRLCDEATRTVLFTDDANEAKAAVDKLLAHARRRGWIG